MLIADWAILAIIVAIFCWAHGTIDNIVGHFKVYMILDQVVVGFELLYKVVWQPVD